MSVLSTRTTIKTSAFLIGIQTALIITSLFLKIPVSLLYDNSPTNISIQVLTSFYTIKEGVYSLFTKNKKRMLLYIIWYIGKQLFNPIWIYDHKSTNFRSALYIIL